jgi:ankyrin repeat protein/Arc/MetJ-type ribon-helix-helix transcriptional regulator
METLGSVWIPIGLITASLMAIFDKDMRSTGMLVFMTLLGPITILVAAFMLIYTFASDSSSPKAKAKTKTKTTGSSRAKKPPAKSLAETFNEIEEVFSSSNAKLPKRGDVVNLQRFAATYAKKGGGDEQVPKQAVVDALLRAIDLIEEIYGDEEIGETRRTALVDSLGRIDPNAIVIQDSNLRNAPAESRKFNLTFDVDKLVADLPGWSLNTGYSSNDEILMTSSDGAKMKFTCHRFTLYRTFDELLDDIKENVSPNEDLKELRPFTKFDTVCGRPLYAAEFFVEEDKEFVSVFYAEGAGFTGVYATIHADSSAYEATFPAFAKLEWWNYPPVDYSRFDTVTKLKRALKAVKSEDSEALDEIASGLNKDEIYLSTYEIWEALEADEAHWPLVKSTIAFALEHEDIVETDWHEFLPILATQGINAPDLYERVLSKVKAESNDVETLLTLAELEDDESERFAYIAKSIGSAEHFYDLEKVVKARINEELWQAISKKVEEKVTDEEYSSISDPLDVLLEGQQRGFLSVHDVLDRVESWINSDQIPSAISGISNSLSYKFGEDEFDEQVAVRAKNLLEQYLDLYQSQVKTDDEIIECYEFLKDSIEDDKRASAFSAVHSAVVDAHEKETEQTEAWDEAINAICKCAILVAAGDGHVSEEEVEEMSKVKPFVNMFVRERECVEILEKTGDRELSRAKRGEIFLMHEMVLFGAPSYVREVFDDVEDIESSEDYFALAQLYASKITDKYHRRLALWAAKEVAEVDGLDDGEAVLLALFTKEFELDPKENMNFFQKVAFPAINDDFATGWKDDSERESAFEEMDQLAEGEGEEAEAARSIMEALGLEGFGDLAKLLSDDDDDDLVEDTEAPAIFAALFEDSEWDDVITAINEGADVNVRMNFSGVEDLHIMTLCAQQGPSHVLRALIQAGADINARVSNPSYASNYEDPLTAALSRDQQENFDILLAAGADPNAKKDGEPGTTPLIVAARHHNWEAFKTLLNSGVDPDVTDHRGWNAIKVLARDGSAKSIKFMRALLKAGCDPNRPDNETYCAIHNAVREEGLKVVKFLIEEAKVPVDQKLRGMTASMDFSTPLDIALSDGNIEISEYLFQQGASLSAGFDTAKAANLSTHNAFTAIFRGGLLNKNFDTRLWLERTFSSAMRPNIESVKELFSTLASDGENAEPPDGWAAGYVTALMKQAEFDEEEFQEIYQEILEDMDDALDSAPELAEEMIEAFERFE